MQYGGYTGGLGGTRVRSNLARYRKIKGASEDVSRRAKQIKEKKAKSGLFGKILGKGLEWGTGALLAPILGPGALIAAKAVGRGVGAYGGAKLGYGDKVGSGLDDTKWLASDRKKLDRSEKGLEESFKSAGYAALASSAKKGATDWVKTQGADSIGSYIGDKIKQKLYWKPDKGKTPMGGGLALPDVPTLSKEPFDYQASGIGTRGRASESPLGGLLSVPPALEPGMGVPPQYGGRDFQLPSISPTPKTPSLIGAGFNLPSLGDPTAGTDPFKYAQSGFGAQAGQRSLLGQQLQKVTGYDHVDKLISKYEDPSSLLAQQPWAQEGFQFAGLPEEGDFGSEILSGQYSPWGNMISGAYAGPMRQQQGGMVRDDNALIDMMYRR